MTGILIAPIGAFGSGELKKTPIFTDFFAQFLAKIFDGGFHGNGSTNRKNIHGLFVFG